VHSGFVRLSLLFALALLLTPAARATNVPAGFSETVLATGLQTPVNVAWAPDGRMFIAERQGTVMVHDPGDPPNVNHRLIDISNHVNSARDFSNDRGLLGIAVDKHFGKNHLLYLLYTYDTNTNDDNAPKSSTLTRITVNKNDTVKGGEKTILGSIHPPDGQCITPPPNLAYDCIPSDGTSHSVGSVRVAPDGTLFVSSGTGANFGQPIDPRQLRAYDQNTFGGKVLHIDTKGRGLRRHPFCPSDTNLNDVCTKVYAEGLRNPYRFDLLPGGGIAVGDVGEDTWEEFDLVPPGGGGNYGWPCYEGPNPEPDFASDPSTQARCQQEYAKAGTPAADIAPAFAFPHPDSDFGPGSPVVGETVIGGPEYTGYEYPPGYRGSLFLGNFLISDTQTTGWIDRVILDRSGRVSSVVPFATNWPIPDGQAGVDLEIAPDGNLVEVSVNDGPPGGVVREVRYPAGEIHFQLRRGAAALARRGLISGGFSTIQRVGRVEVAVWKGTPNVARCRWWSPGRRHLVSGACRGLHFMRAKLKHSGNRFSFTARLRGRLPRGRYTLVLEAVPRGARESASRRQRLHLRVG
jgi:glucose/arabinose dehydrogenase